jgi:hypothetical protein
MTFTIIKALAGRATSDATSKQKVTDPTNGFFMASFLFEFTALNLQRVLRERRTALVPLSPHIRDGSDGDKQKHQ